MFSVPWMPSNASPWFWASVIGCGVFWIAAYVLIIRHGIRERSFGMPLTAMCWNISWEVLFAFVYPPDYLLIRVGNTLWIALDIVILWIAWKHAPADFPEGWPRRVVRPGIVLGLVVATVLQIPMAHEYHDMKGYLTGWMAALMMAILFPALLLRRNSLKGQSLWIAIAMLGGNIWAWVWVKTYPDNPPNAVINPAINNLFFIATCSFNALYAVLVHRRAKELQINPWTRF
ncbi:MAG: hypothetical protein AB7O66_00310 [Limisphaerales bacterium]